MKTNVMHKLSTVLRFDTLHFDFYYVYTIKKMAMSVLSITFYFGLNFDSTHKLSFKIAKANKTVKDL